MPEARLEQQLAQTEDATSRFLDALAGIDDDWCRAPSRLPGWSRAHVLTHLARNADALERLASAAAAGRQVTMYGPGDAREAEIEAGAGRPADELVADVRNSAERLYATCQALPGEAWDREPEWRNGRRQPLADIPRARLVEVEVHRVDLGCGYHHTAWPESHARVVLDVAVARLGSLPEPPPFRIHVDGDAAPAGEHDDGTRIAVPVVAGRPADLAAWLTGRGDATGLRFDEPLPDVPAVWS